MLPKQSVGQFLARLFTKHQRQMGDGPPDVPGPDDYPGHVPPRPMPPPAAGPAPQVIYVSKERALHEARALADRLAARVATVSQCVEQLRGKADECDDGTTDLHNAIAEAMATGAGSIGAFVGRRSWWMDDYLLAEFTSAMRAAGFSVQRHVHESDGPEDDQKVLVIRPLAGVPPTE